MAKQFIVQGGEYVDTTFSELVPDTLESYGPFTNYAEARVVWFANTCKKVDNCHHRLRIITVHLTADNKWLD